MNSEAAIQAGQWLDELGSISDESPRLTRTFLSPAHRQAKLLLARWMHDAGLLVFEDAAGNLIGHWSCGNPEAGTIVCGSHLDTVRDAGKYDGAMGVIAGVLAARELILSGTNLPFHLEIVAFSDEEGVRFQSTYLGSRHYTGLLTPAELARCDAKGCSVERAIAEHKPDFPTPPARKHLSAYFEVHIEQGPFLERNNLPLGVVTAIAGQTRIRALVKGRSGHAGTTPMNMRQDALTGAAECITLIEKLAADMTGLVATVGEIRVPFGASNVIPGRVEFTIDIRDADDSARAKFTADLLTRLETLLSRRGLTLQIDTPLSAPSVPCSPSLTGKLAGLVASLQGVCPKLVSGAGHDAVAMAEVTDIALLFVRCREGLSHHPDEYADPEDIALAVKVLAGTIASFSR